MRQVLAPAPRAPVVAGPAPSFSVIVAARDAESTIAAAVASVLSQTAPPLEVIICDDGSRDGTAAALAPFGDRVTVLSQEPAGPGAARNRAAAAARGDFVAILDADDTYLPERLEALGELGASRPDLDILATDAVIEVDGERRGTFNGAEHRFEVADQPAAILERAFLLGNAAVRRERLLAAGGFDESLESAEDWDLWIRLILAGSRAGSVDEPLAVYEMTPGSLTAERAAALRCRVRALEKAARDPGLEPRLRPLLERSLAAHRARAELAEAEAALRDGSPEARRRALAVVRGSGHGPRTRLKAAFAALAPRAAARALDRRRRAGLASGRLERPAERASGR